MTKAILPPAEPPKKLEPNRSAPEPLAEDPHTLDWDVSIETPPPRRTGILRVTLDPLGRGRPMPAADPGSDD